MAVAQIPPELDLIEFRQAWDEWLEYKKQKHDTYTPIGAKRTLTKLAKFGGAWAIARIDKSITNNWKGLVFDNDEPNAGNPNAKKRTNKAGEYPSNLPSLTTVTR